MVLYLLSVNFPCLIEYEVMDHKYKALLQNIPTRHVITAIAKQADRRTQIEKLRNLDINNFFILGSLQSIRDVLGAFCTYFRECIWGLFWRQLIVHLYLSMCRRGQR